MFHVMLRFMLMVPVWGVISLLLRRVGGYKGRRISGLTATFGLQKIQIILGLIKDSFTAMVINGHFWLICTVVEEVHEMFYGGLCYLILLHFKQV